MFRVSLKDVFVFGAFYCISAISSGEVRADTWVCTAKNLVFGQYNGGSAAYIHLSPFPTGGNYPVEKDKSGKVAIGKTANGTKFICKRS